MSQPRITSRTIVRWFLEAFKENLEKIEGLDVGAVWGKLQQDAREGRIGFSDDLQEAEAQQRAGIF